MSTRVGVNGFGRIGRVFFRTALESKDIEVVGVNDLADAKTLGHLLKHDSVHGTPAADVQAKGEAIFVNGREVRVCAQKDPAALPWRELGVDVVVESTGIFRDTATASKHLQAGAKKVIITAPAKDPDVTLVLGVNEAAYEPSRHRVPTANVSVVDLVAELEKPAMVNAVNDAFREAAAGRLRGILEVCEEQLVSCDFNGNPHSSIVDLPSTALIEGNLVKVLAWYDNEWGYSCRVRDLIRFIGKTL